MHRFLIYSIFFFFLGCGTPFYVPKDSQREKIEERIENPYFKSGEEYLFRATIEAYGHTFNGILAIKTTSLSYRVALTTDFGNTLLDFSYNKEDQWRVNYINEDLDRKILIRLLQRDFSDLLRTFHSTEKYVTLREVIYLSEEGKEKSYLFVNQDKNVYQQINTKGSNKYTTFKFSCERKGELRQVIIEHHTLQVKITLNLL